ncbi:MAG: HEAT repeat domain-containing protein [Thermodesulfobacteriota bacterium]|nr:HEAT repeat domain-containing protein [Thermodesulfobacteriota bacterium]
MKGRKLKKKILELLGRDDLEKSLDEICQLPARQAVNPLFSFFYSTNELIKWRAITAMGAVVFRLAEQDMESARVVMRRLIWNLNDESGGIGWGSPEAMGEIMSRHFRLAEEYAFLLVSYVNEQGNYLEHPTLQRGVLWGLGRLAHSRPRLVEHAVSFLPPYMRSEDAFHRGLAAWTAGALGSELTKPLLQHLANDNAKIKIYINMHLIENTVGQLAREALSKL